MSKLYPIASIALICLFILDWQTRFNSDELINRNQFELISPKSESVPLLNPQVNQLLSNTLTAFSELKADIAAKPNNSVMSADKQAAQQGELLTVFAGENALSLKAVINDEQIYVLIAQKNIKTGQVEVTKYPDGASLAGYQLSVLSNTQVTLTNNNQHIILMMYKSAA